MADVPVGAGNDREPPSLADHRNNIKAACLAAKAAYPGSTWNDPGEEPDVQFDTLVADYDRLRAALSGIRFVLDDYSESRIDSLVAVGKIGLRLYAEPLS